jgi:hypothetical protein
MSLMRFLGRMGGSIWGNKEFITGVLQGADPREAAEAFNENVAVLGGFMKNLDPKAMTVGLIASLQFAGEMMQHVASILAVGLAEEEEPEEPETSSASPAGTGELEPYLPD